MVEGWRVAYRQMHGKWKEDDEHNGKFDNILTKVRERNRYVGRKCTAQMVE